MKVIVIVIMEWIADHVRVFKVFEEFCLVESALISFPHSFVPSRVHGECRWWLCSELWNVAPVAVHIIITNHYSWLLCLVTLMTVDCLWMMSFFLLFEITIIKLIQIKLIIQVCNHG